MIEDEMVGWHHRLNRDELEQALEDGEGQGSMVLSMGSHSRFRTHPSVFTSVTQSCPTLYDPMDCTTPGLLVHYQLPEFTQTHVY